MTEGVLSLGSWSVAMNLCPQSHSVPALAALSPGGAPGARCRRAEDGGGGGSGRRGRAGGAGAIGGTRLPPGGDKRLAQRPPPLGPGPSSRAHLTGRCFSPHRSLRARGSVAL